MSDKTGISWTDATWAPARGCSRVSEGCRNCYAERIAARFSKPGQPFHGFAQIVAPRDHMDATGGRRNGWTRKVEFQPDQLAIPLRWRKGRRIFCSSMTDVFHESLANEEIAAMFGVMAACPQHTFQVLTKRSKRMREWFAWLAEQRTPLITIPFSPRLTCRCEADRILNPDNDRRVLGTEPNPREWPLPNVWIGVSVENQAAADDRIPDLLATPSAVRFLSVEPLLGEVDLDMARCDDQNHGAAEWCVADDEATPWCVECDSERSYGHWLHLDGGIDWVIAGCESGPGARPCNVAWLISIRDQCEEAGVPYFLKQATEEDSCTECGDVLVDNEEGEPTCTCCGRPGQKPAITAGPGSKRKAGGVIELPYLDGVQHAAFPEGSQ